MSASSNNLAIVYVNRGDLEKGEKFYRQSLEFDKKLGDLRGRSLVMINLGELLITKGEIKEGERLFREIVEIKKSIEDLEGLGFAYNGLADTLFIQGKYKESLENVNRAIESFSEIGYKEGIGFTLILSSKICFQMGDVNEAFNKLNESADIYRKLEDNISLEAVELLKLEYRIKMGEKVDLPPLKNDNNAESYYYLKSLLSVLDRNRDEVIKNLEMCRVYAEKSKNFIAEKFYCGAKQVISSTQSDCVEELKKRGINHYLNELKYFKQLSPN